MKMKLFGWIQSKLANAGKPGNEKPDTVLASRKHSSIRDHKVPKQEPREELSEWHHNFLAIGTFGNTVPKERARNKKLQDNDNPSSSDEFSAFTPEEFGKLQKELTKLLTLKPNRNITSNLPLDRFLNCPSSLEVDRRIGNALGRDSDDREDHEEDIDRTISVIIGKCKEIWADKRNKAIGKRSVSFLLKKMFVCRSGFAPAPSLRGSIQESRIEKLLRTILLKKIFARNSSQEPSIKKYLEDKETAKMDIDDEDEMPEKDSDGKWVKTDSEYIVLEI